MHKIDAAGRLVARNTILYEGAGQVIAAVHAWQQFTMALTCSPISGSGIPMAATSAIAG